MILFRCLITSGIVISAASWANAGVRFDFRGGERSGSGRPFNFAVSTTSHTPAGVWTAEDFSGEDLGPKNRRLTLRDSLQVNYKERGAFDIFRASSKSSKRRENREGSTGGSVNAGGFLPVFNDDIAGEQTNGQRPVNAGYCYCPEKPGGDDDDGDDDDGGLPGDDDDDDDDGQTGGGDDDDDDDDGQPGGGGDDDDDGEGEGGGPDPSVVPEPGSFALWALAGALLIGVTRRQTTQS
jgi:hypothetical protein